MKPETHKKLTELAIEMCNEKGILSSSLKNKENQKEVVQGTIDEDKNTLKERITNWHFYRPETSSIPKKYKAIFKTTSEDICDKRIEKFMSTQVDEIEHFNLFGRIIHHIQDMNTPSHVIPIFHGPKLPFWSLGKIKDYFEEFLNKHLDIIEKDSTIIDDMSCGDVNSFEDLYKVA